MGWDDAAPTPNEISATSAHAWDAAPPSKDELASVSKTAAVPAPEAKAKSNDEMINENIKRMTEADDAKGDAFMDTLALGHLPHIKAKIKQLIAGEGYHNDENYVKRRDEEIAHLKDEEEKYPVGTFIGRAGGVIAPMLATGGASALESAGEAIPFVTRLGKSILSSAKMGAIYGAGQNPGDVEGKVDPLQLKERAENAKTGAEFGAAVGTAVPIIGAAAQSDTAKGAAKWTAQKVGKVFAGVGEETTGRYLENAEAINKAPARSDISDRLLELKKGADDNVAKAHEELSSARQQMTEAKNDTRAGLNDQKFDTGRELNEHQANFNEKKQQFKEALKTNNLTSMAGEVNDAVGKLKEKVVQGSQDAYEILDKEKGSVGIDPIMKVLKGHYDNQFINEVPKTNATAQTAAEVRDMQDKLFQMTRKTDGKLSMPQAKELIQSLDKTIDYGSKQAGGFAPETEQMLRDVRGSLDKSLKSQSSAYAEKMGEVSEQAKLLNDANKLYGTPEKAIQNLNNIDSEKGQAIHVPLLKALSDHTGKDLREPVAGYLYNQKVLSTPSLFDQLIHEQPEGKALAASKAKMEQISNPEYQRTVSEKAIAPLQGKMTQAEAQLEAARERAKTFSGVTADSVTGKTKALNGANSYGAEERFGKIDKEYGTNFEKEIQARNDADQFEKTSTEGSRKSIVGGGIGGMIGWLGGHTPESAAIGYAAGSAAGSAADKYAGKVFKSALDKGMSVGKAAAAAGKTIEGTAPKLTKAAMLAGVATKGPDKWAADGFSKLVDHGSAEEKDILNRIPDDALKSKNIKNLLISASDLKPGSKAMDDIMSKVKAQLEAEK